MNHLIQYFVPDWISIFFLICIPLPFVLLAFFVQKEVKDTIYQKASLYLVLFFAIYLSYIFLAAKLGWFNAVSLPPKVLLLTTFPFAFFLFLVIANTKFYRLILEKAAIENLVKLHIFRVIGVFFILLGLYDALPKPFAFIAGLGDVITAITSVFVVSAIKSKKNLCQKALLLLEYFWYA